MFSLNLKSGMVLFTNKIFNNQLNHILYWHGFDQINTHSLSNPQKYILMHDTGKSWIDIKALHIKQG